MNYDGKPGGTEKFLFSQRNPLLSACSQSNIIMKYLLYIYIYTCVSKYSSVVRIEYNVELFSFIYKFNPTTIVELKIVCQKARGGLDFRFYQGKKMIPIQELPN